MIRHTLVLLCMVTALSILLDAGTAFGATKVYRDTVLRDIPSYLGVAKTTVKEGTRIRTTGEEDQWHNIRAGNLQGWLHGSALTPPDRILTDPGGSSGTKAGGKEEILAIKGFDAATEAEQRKNRNFNYTAVDLMQSYIVPPLDRIVFLEIGAEGVGQ